MNITNGGTVSNATGYLGYYTPAAGVATVDGTGSTWTNTGPLYIGYSGTGTLNITNGGAVTATGTTYVGYTTGSTGMINFGTGGGTLTTQGLLAATTQLTGTGTINTRGLVGDVNLVFDSGPSTTTILNQSGQNVTVNLDMSDSSNVSDLGVGYSGSGSLTIRNGITVNSVNGFLGYKTGSTGVATVDGLGSTWTNSGNLRVGKSGSGTLTISNGGTVSVNTIIGGSGSTGAMVLNFDGGVLKPYNAGNTNWISKGTGAANVYVKEGGAYSTPAATL